MLFFNIAHYVLRPWPWILVGLCSLIVYPQLSDIQAAYPNLDPRLLVVSLVGLTLFPLAAQSIWRRMFDAHDVDVAALERHTLALLDHGFGGTHAR